MESEPIYIKLERRLRCVTITAEGPDAILAKFIWNRQFCDYRGNCILQKFREEHQPKPCLYNPKMLKCPAYFHHLMPKLLAERNN